MNHYLLNISYDGTPFSGWQRLSDRPDTIQQLIESALSDLLSEKIQIHGSGRTDAKVSAINQYADFFSKAEPDLDILPMKINNLLPDAIRIRWVRRVAADFHSRKSCQSKTYCYHISLNSKSDVFTHRHIFQPCNLMLADQILNKHILQDGTIKLNEYAMNKAAAYLIGKMDYSAYTSDKTPGKSHIREIYQISIVHHILKSGAEELLLSFTGSGFLYNMVRILAGTLLYTGLDVINPESIPDITKAGIRENAGPTLPAHALFLFDVSYHSFN